MGLSSTTPTICTASGNNIQLLRPGVCSITASQTGNSVYLPAPLVVRSFNINPGPPVILSFATQPTSGTARTALPNIRIQALDAFGNPNPAFNQTITLAIASGTLGASFICSAPSPAVGGVATFESCQFDRPGTYTLAASAPGVTATTSISIRIFEQFVPPEFSFNVSTLQLTATTGNIGSLASMLLFNTSDGASFRFTSVPAWLRLEQRTSGNPGLFWLTPDATNLAPGNYSGQLIADMPAFSLRTAIDLRLTVLPCSASVHPDRLTLRPAQLSAGVLVGAERTCAWAPSTSATWVKLNPAVTSGTGGLSFTFEPNLTGQPRAATVTILNTQFTILQP